MSDGITDTRSQGGLPEIAPNMDEAICSCIRKRMGMVIMEAPGLDDLTRGQLRRLVNDLTLQASLGVREARNLMKSRI